jgi:hypothetical protein
MNNQLKSLFFIIIFLNINSLVNAQDKQPEDIIKAKVNETGLKHSITSLGYVKFQFTLNNDRSQVVTIRDKTIEHPTGKYFELIAYSIKIETKINIEKIAIELLKKNWSYKNFSWQLYESEGNYYFVLGAKVHTNTTSVGLYRTLQEIAEEADLIESKFTQKDEF